MFKIDTKCVQSGYEPDNGEARVLPIYQSTTFKYDTAETVGDLFDLKVPGHMYTRISNPTAECVEKKISDLEGGAAAILTSSGQAAVMLAILNVAGTGDHILVSDKLYGGTVNLFFVTMKRMGIEVTQVVPGVPLGKQIRTNTKALFAESVSNPQVDVLDFDAYAAAAKQAGIPFIVDNTFPTPVNCRPFEFGADIIVHSASKYMDGHACVVSGAVVESGKFDWQNGKFPGLCSPDPSYHGVNYCRDFAGAPFVTKARVQLMRDLGVSPQPIAAFLLNLGLETLALRMERHCQNALAAAKYLSAHPKIEWVKYPGLETDTAYPAAQKYMKDGQTCGVLAFGVRGGRSAAAKLMNGLKLAKIVVHVADNRTSVLHPATSTHRQLTDAQLKAAGIGPEMIRLSVGIEHPDDIVADLEQALRQ
ncbi:MAG: PLP-dependent transferase [Firmicutes bacterium]|nr:PLP-dependent transferase [Bacillota bacterium]